MTNNTMVHNVLDYGLIGDGITDNTKLFKEMLDKIAPKYKDGSATKGAVIYFPIGEYLITDEIQLNQPLKLLGESDLKNRNNIPTKEYPESIIKFVPTKSNKTLFKYVGSKEFEINGLTLVSDSYRIEYNKDNFISIPYPVFKEIKTLEEINGLDLTLNSSNISIKNCSFIGFSGVGLIVKNHRYINDCNFMHCNVGIEQTGTDSIVQNCWVNKGNIGILCSHKVYNYSNLEVSNTWCDQMKSHFIKADNPSKNTTVMLLVNDCWVDMINNAAIYSTGQLHHSRITGRFSRIGMEYSGLSNINKTKDIMYKTDVIVAKSIIKAFINISVQKREIGSLSNHNNSDDKCPHSLISAFGGTGKGKISNSKIIIDEDFNNIIDIEHSSFYNSLIVTSDNINQSKNDEIVTFLNI